ncbi:PsbP-related protein [Psychrobacillus sp. L3]|uniref:PsbP-related protein n=1 Tax=Psychrobacillus sp. L3 TaxID=3236891 RepID=UPI0036F39998
MKVILSIIIVWIFPFQNIYVSAETYTDEKHHFSLELPEGWVEQDIPEIDGAEYIAAFNKGDVYPYILIQQFSDTGNLKELKNSIDDYYLNLNESGLPISNVTYGGSTIDIDKNALLYSYTARNENTGTFEAKGAMFVGSGISTQVLFYTDLTSDKNDEDFNKIIEQFQYAEGNKVINSDPLVDTVAKMLVTAIIIVIIIVGIAIRKRENRSKDSL